MVYDLTLQVEKSTNILKIIWLVAIFAVRNKTDQANILGFKYIKSYKPVNGLHTVKTCIIETRIFLSSVDMCLISGMVFLMPACKILNKLRSQNSSITILSYVVKLESTDSL